MLIADPSAVYDKGVRDKIGRMFTRIVDEVKAVSPVYRLSFVFLYFIEDDER